MNEQSLERVNAFLAAVADRTEQGELLEATPAELGRELGFPIHCRSLVQCGPLSRGADWSPQLAPTVSWTDRRSPRASERRSTAKAGAPASGRRTPGAARRGGLAYSDLGRATVDRLVELGQEVSQLRAQLKTSREEARQNREMRAEAERRARTLAERARELEHRVDMAESNLRTLLASARATGMHPDQRLPDSEMEAILGVLKGNGDQPSEEETSQPEPMGRPVEEFRSPTGPAAEEA